MEDAEHSFAFVERQCARRARALLRLRDWCALACLHSIELATRDIQRRASRLDTDLSGKCEGGFHQSVPPSWVVLKGSPSIWDTFFWTSMMISARRRRSVNRSLSRRSFS